MQRYSGFSLGEEGITAWGTKTLQHMSKNKEKCGNMWGEYHWKLLIKSTYLDLVPPECVQWSVWIKDLRARLFIHNNPFGLRIVHEPANEALFPNLTMHERTHAVLITQSFLCGCRLRIYSFWCCCKPNIYALQHAAVWYK